MATDENRGVSTDANSDSSPNRSLLATDFARDPAVTISDNMATEWSIAH